MNRRTFLKSTTLAGGSLLLSFQFPLLAYRTEKAFIEPNAYLRISKDNTVTFRMTDPEIGQGIYTGLTMIIVEELGVALEAIKIEKIAYSQKNKALYKHFDGVGGSTTIMKAWQPLREAGARTRPMFVQAAASQWKVKASECDVNSYQ